MCHRPSAERWRESCASFAHAFLRKSYRTQPLGERMCSALYAGLMLHQPTNRQMHLFLLLLDGHAPPWAFNMIAHARRALRSAGLEPESGDLEATVLAPGQWADLLAPICAPLPHAEALAEACLRTLNRVHETGISLGLGFPRKTPSARPASATASRPGSGSSPVARYSPRRAHSPSPSPSPSPQRTPHSRSTPGRLSTPGRAHRRHRRSPPPIDVVELGRRAPVTAALFVDVLLAEFLRAGAAPRSPSHALISPPPHPLWTPPPAAAPPPSLRTPRTPHVPDFASQRPARHMIRIAASPMGPCLHVHAEAQTGPFSTIVERPVRILGEEARLAMQHGARVRQQLGEHIVHLSLTQSCLREDLARRDRSLSTVAEGAARVTRLLEQFRREVAPSESTAPAPRDDPFAQTAWSESLCIPTSAGTLAACLARLCALDQRIGRLTTVFPHLVRWAARKQATVERLRSDLAEHRARNPTLYHAIKTRPKPGPLRPPSEFGGPVGYPDPGVPTHRLDALTSPVVSRARGLRIETNELPPVEEEVREGPRQREELAQLRRRVDAQQRSLTQARRQLAEKSKLCEALKKQKGLLAQRMQLLKPGGALFEALVTERIQAAMLQGKTLGDLTLFAVHNLCLLRAYPCPEAIQWGVQAHAVESEILTLDLDAAEVSFTLHAPGARGGDKPLYRSDPLRPGQPGWQSLPLPPLSSPAFRPACATCVQLEWPPVRRTKLPSTLLKGHECVACVWLRHQRARVLLHEESIRIVSLRPWNPSGVSLRPPASSPLSPSPTEPLPADPRPPTGRCALVLSLALASQGRTGLPHDELAAFTTPEGAQCFCQDLAAQTRALCEEAEEEGT